MNKIQATKLYNNLIDEVLLLHRSNPCRIRPITNGAACIGEFGVPCCHHKCPMLDAKTGCKTNNIACKNYLCPEALVNLKADDPEMYERWIVLSGIIGKLKLKGVRYKHQDVAIDKLMTVNISKVQQTQDILNNILYDLSV